MNPKIGIQLIFLMILASIVFFHFLLKSISGRSTRSNRGVSLLPYLSKYKENLDGKKRSLNNRPVIHSYYVAKTDIQKALENNPMLRTWAEMWSDIGWDPVLLTLDDSKYHDDFVKHVAEGMDITSHAVRYPRYLAMSTVPGGGWFSEYHVFPLHPLLDDPIQKQNPSVLPNKGKFTGHDKHVPSLLSGNQWEWTRIAHALINHPLEEDVLALHDLHSQNPDSYFYESSVISYRFLTMNPRNFEVPLLCEITKNKRAIRISPEDVKNAQQQVLPTNNYHEVTRHFMSMWRSACLTQNPIK